MGGEGDSAVTVEVGGLWLQKRGEEADEVFR